jgi:hypothetical protein
VAKVGRNDPCPCGSGKKYKQCHGRPAAAASSDDHSGAVTRALEWLDQRHRKAVQAFLDELIFDELWPEENPDPQAIGEDLWEMVAINAREWLLAHGHLGVRGRSVPVRELLCGPGGPGLRSGQKAFLQQLADRPLRLYEVTDSRPGEGLMLVDALDQQAEPLFVQERTGSQSLLPGALLGTRIVSVGDHYELSGAMYPFTEVYAGALIPVAREFAANLEQEVPAEERPLEMAFFIAEHWLAHITLPQPIPRITDASTGEPMLLVTDHYRVVDRGALEAALAASAALQQVDDEHWDWPETDEQGVTRSRLSLSVHGGGRRAERVQVFARTQKLADEGRSWFDSLAGDSVAYLTREITDPVGALSADGPETPGAVPRGGPASSPQIPPEQMSELIAQYIRRQYANWADEPIPALGDQTPRQAVTTSAGLERVKGLLRSYEAREREMAEQDNRDPVSYQFLWDALGIQRGRD